MSDLSRAACPAGWATVTLDLGTIPHPAGAGPLPLRGVAAARWTSSHSLRHRCLGGEVWVRGEWRWVAWNRDTGRVSWPGALIEELGACWCLGTGRARDDVTRCTYCMAGVRGPRRAGSPISCPICEDSRVITMPDGGTLPCPACALDPR